jgi:hypothetical protein
MADDLEDEVGSCKLPQRLDLSVGGNGVVGRAVSVLHAGDGQVIGQGVVGYGY